MPVPENCSMIEAAAIPEAFATAYLNLFIEGHLEEGQTAFIPAGASGLHRIKRDDVDLRRKSMMYSKRCMMFLRNDVFFKT